MMTTTSRVLAAALLAASGWAMPAQAQGVPGGSYLRSCTGAHLERGTLVARCRTGEGYEQRTALDRVRRCVGDIGNENGVLVCNFPDGQPVYGQVLQEPEHHGYEAPPYGAPPYGGPQYGAAPYGPPPYSGPPYGAPPYGR